MDLAIKSVAVFSGRDKDSVVPDPDQRYFSGVIKDLQMTVSSWTSSNTDLKNIDESMRLLTNLPLSHVTCQKTKETLTCKHKLIAVSRQFQFFKSKCPPVDCFEELKQR